MDVVAHREFAVRLVDRALVHVDQHLHVLRLEEDAVARDFDNFARQLVDGHGNINRIRRHLRGDGAGHLSIVGHANRLAQVRNALRQLRQGGQVDLNLLTIRGFHGDVRLDDRASKDGFLLRRGNLLGADLPRQAHRDHAAEIHVDFRAIGDLRQLFRRRVNDVGRLVGGEGEALVGDVADRTREDVAANVLRRHLRGVGAGHLPVVHDVDEVAHRDFLALADGVRRQNRLNQLSFGRFQQDGFFADFQHRPSNFRDFRHVAFLGISGQQQRRHQQRHQDCKHLLHIRVSPCGGECQGFFCPAL